VKTRAARLINTHHGTPAVPVWQRSFHDRVLRTPHELYRAIRYIHDNPERWARAHPGAAAAPIRDP
jgi:putative transposase